MSALLESCIMKCFIWVDESANQAPASAEQWPDIPDSRLGLIYEHVIKRSAAVSA